MSTVQKYKLEFILHVYEASLQSVKSSLAEFGENLLVVVSEETQENGKDFIIKINAEDPQLVFDICSQFGRIRSAKIDQDKE